MIVYVVMKLKDVYVDAIRQTVEMPVVHGVYSDKDYAQQVAYSLESYEEAKVVEEVMI